jgi:hypothetical protein
MKVTRKFLKIALSMNSVILLINLLIAQGSAAMPLLTAQKDTIRSVIDYYFQFDTKAILLAEIQNIERAFMNTLEAKSEFDDLQKLISKPQDFLQRLDELNPDITTIGEVQSYMLEVATEELQKEAVKHGVSHLAWKPADILNALQAKATFNERFKAIVHCHENFDYEWDLPILKNKIYEARLSPEDTDELTKHVYATLTIAASPQAIDAKFQIKRIPYFYASIAEKKAIEDEVDEVILNAESKEMADAIDRKKLIDKKTSALLDLKESSFIVATVQMAPAVIEAKAQELILTYFNQRITEEHNGIHFEMADSDAESEAPEEDAENEPLLRRDSSDSDNEGMAEEDEEEEDNGVTLISGATAGVRLLTNTYYFKEIEAKRLSAMALNALTQEQVDFLDLSSTVSLISTPSVNLTFITALQLTPNERKLTQIYEFYQMLAQQKLSIQAIKGTTNSQYEIVRQRLITSLISAMKIPFSNARTLSATGAALFSLPFYQEALLNNQITFLAFTFLNNDARLTNLMHPDIIQLFMQQIPSNGALRIMSFKPYFDMIRSSKLKYSDLANISDLAAIHLEINGIAKLIEADIITLNGALSLSHQICLRLSRPKTLQLLLHSKITISQLINMSPATANLLEQHTPLSGLTKEAIAQKISQWESVNSIYSTPARSLLFAPAPLSEQIPLRMPSFNNASRGPRQSR